MHHHNANRRDEPTPPTSFVIDLSTITGTVPFREADPRPAELLWLTALEHAVIDELLGRGQRRTLAQLTDAIERESGEPVCEGTLKAMLARMTGCGILENSRTAKPPGYRVSVAYRAFMAWARRAEG